jgi:hypothetical protein
MGGYGGYGKQNGYMKEIIQILIDLINEINQVEESIYSEKLFNEWGKSSKLKVIDFIKNKINSNEILLLQLEKINCNVMSEIELKECIEKLVQFCNKIKFLLIKSKDIADFQKLLELSNYKEELDSQKKEIDVKVIEINSLLENAKKANTILDEKSKEAFTKILLDKEAFDYKYAEGEYRKLSKYWLSGSVGIVFILIAIVCYKSTKVSELVGIRQDLCYLAIQDKIMLYIAYTKYICSYVLIYSVLIYALKVSIKNYNANKHNEIINKNKILILYSTFNLYQEGKDPELLYIAAKELFTQHSTGYNNNTEEKSTSNIVNTIVDTVSKNATS